MSDAQNARLGIYGGHSDGTENLGLDRFESLQEPKIDPGTDPLARFVMARIIEAELEPRGEVMAAYDQPAGPIAYRYAKGVRRDMVVFRKVVARYLEMKATRDAEPDKDVAVIFAAVAVGLGEAVQHIADRWSEHPDWRVDWRG